MDSDSASYYRRSIRMKGFDYGQPGYYSVTICLKDHDCTYGFGSVIDGKMHLNSRGEIAVSVWNSLPQRFPDTELDCFVFMPNHMHGILVRKDWTPPLESGKLLPPPSPNSPHYQLLTMMHDVKGRPLILGEIIRTFKAVTTRLVRVEGTPGFAWQRDYYESVIQSQQYLDRLRSYIINNPAKWLEDSLHPQAKKKK